jgi:hypothetical protein
MDSPQDFGLKQAAYSVAGVTELTSLCRTKIFALVKAGQLRSTASISGCSVPDNAFAMNASCDSDVIDVTPW